MNHWLLLFIAGGLEVAFAVCLKLSEGFTRHIFTAAFLVMAVLSFYFLSRAIEVIPIGTAYAVWTGIGAFGTAIVGMWLFHEPVSLLRILLLANLIGSIIALKFLARAAA